MMTKNLLYYVGITIVIANNLSQTIDAIITVKWSFIISFIVVIVGIIMDEKEMKKLK